MAISYKDSGVDIEKGDLFVERIKKLVGKTYNQNVCSGVGGFASLYKIDEDRFLAAGTDGVGTKLKIAQQLGIHNTIGIDLVAMCVNDIICTGARPLFFLDYFATGKLELEVSESVLEGITEGCLQSKMALVGGETAEMPGMYQNGEYDLAGFAVGEVYKKDLLDGSRISDGDTLIGIASSGFHSNGFSLVRKVVESHETELLKQALTPTRIYVKLVEELRHQTGAAIKGIAHITGSGFENIPRLNEQFDYEIDQLPQKSELPIFMSEIMERTGLTTRELLTTFNYGVGLVIATDQPDLVTSTLEKMNEKFWNLGKIQKGSNSKEGQLRLNI